MIIWLSADGLTDFLGDPNMRKITAGLFMALDGVVQDPQNWHFPYFNDEMGAAVSAQLGNSDTILLGRKTYDSFAGACPGAKRPAKRTRKWQRRSATHARSSCLASG
jgi:dihydrofolate reductase